MTTYADIADMRGARPFRDFDIVMLATGRNQHIGSLWRSEGAVACGADMVHVLVV